MVKRKPISFNNEELTKNLKESAGQGIDAFFSAVPPPEVIKVEKPEKVIKQESKQASKLAILQFTDDEINELKEPAYKGQTYRLTDQEIEWLKDTAYRLNKVSKKTRVAQVDLVRIAFKLLAKLIESNEADLMEILQRIK